MKIFSVCSNYNMLAGTIFGQKGKYISEIRIIKFFIVDMVVMCVIAFSSPPV